MRTEAVGMSLRIQAGVVDVLLAVFPSIALAFAVGLFLTDIGVDPLHTTRPLLRTLPLWVIAYLSTEAFFGWTFGKRAAKVVVRAVDGGPASLRRLLVRWVAKYFWVLIGPLGSQLPTPLPNVTTAAWLLGLGGFLFALRPGHQALWDMLAGTAVYPSRAVPTERPR